MEPKNLSSACTNSMLVLYRLPKIGIKFFNFIPPFIRLYIHTRNILFFRLSCVHVQSTYVYISLAEAAVETAAHSWTLFFIVLQTVSHAYWNSHIYKFSNARIVWITWVMAFSANKLFHVQWANFHAYTGKNFPFFRKFERENGKMKKNFRILFSFLL